MRRYFTYTTLGALVALSGPGLVTSGQENQQGSHEEQQSAQQQQQEKQEKQQKQKQQKQSDKEQESNQQQKSEQQRRQQEQQSESSDKRKQGSRDQTSGGEAEVRLHYNDDKSRLSIDVDEEIQFDNRSDRRDVLRGGEIELRYDTDQNDLRTSGEGTVDVDRAVSQMGRWWQSWWEDERQRRRGRTEGAVIGAGAFISQYDDNNDQRLTNRELPPHMRNDFQLLDRNDDNYLTRQELSRYGEIYFDQRQGSARTQPLRSSASNNSNDRSWSQWWSSWWSDDQSGRSQQEVASSGSHQLLRTYDENQDGYLAKNELPTRMREDFNYVDRNNDGYISRNEVQQYGYALRTQRSESRRAANSSGGSNRAQYAGGTQSSSSDDQTWSQWWSSWWSDDSSGQSRQEIAANGARQFLRQNDDNDDEVIVRSEMPRGMYDEFQRIDTNSDRRLSRQEISAYASRTGEQIAGQSRQRSGEPAGPGRGKNSNPMNTAYVWIIDANHGHLKREEIQEAYGLLRKLDANADGEISQDELDQRREQAVSEWCEKCFDKLDQNSDDRLSKSEAENSMFAENFDQHDENGDSRLSRSEAKQGIQNELESHSAARSQPGQSDRR